ncbi:hypothetical protein AN219_38040 [Streptomyces nanshensis]|nr:hypothetical protein AN219_38040 [Streptomyces nanshensis]
MLVIAERRQGRCVYDSDMSLAPAEYADFCVAYGTDVTAWEGYTTLRAIRELRLTTYAAQHAATRPEWRDQAQDRVDCLRGRAGPRPWRWVGIQ